MKNLISDIRSDDSKELQARINDLRKEQFQLRFKGADGSSTNRHREVRRTIARILTVLAERARSGDKKP